MFIFKNTHNIFHKVLRSENVHVFYRANSVFSFAAVYLIYRYFKEQIMLAKVYFVPIENAEDYDEYWLSIRKTDKALNSKFFFIDCDLEIGDIFPFLHNDPIAVNIIDSKKSVLDGFINKVKLTPSINRERIVFQSSDTSSFIEVTWRLLSSEPAPDFVRNYGALYLNPLIEAFGYQQKTYLLTKHIMDFEQWDSFFENNLHLSTYNVGLNITHELTQIISIIKRNWFSQSVLDLKAVCANIPKNLMTPAATICMSEPLCDIVILFEKAEKTFYYEIHTIKDVDLLKLFSKYKPHGFSRKIHFKTKHDIFVKQPNFIQRLLGA